MREIDDAADAEDQRQAERDQKVVPSEHEAIHHLFQQECELHGWRSRRRRRLDYREQGFCSRVGASNSSGSFASGTAVPSAMKSHWSLAWPFGLTVNG